MLVRRIVVAVESLSHVLLLVIPWTTACQASLSFAISRSLLRFMSIGAVMLSNHLILCCPLLLVFSFSQHHGLHQCVRSTHQVTKVLELQLQHQFFQWILGLIFSRINWFDLLAVSGTLKIFSNTIIWKHQFFDTQPSLWSNSHIHTSLLEKP